MALAVFLGSGMALAAALREVPDTGTIGVNGRIFSIVHKGDRIYLGGVFTRVTDKEGKTFTRNNLAAIDATTGRLTGWNPNATNSSGTSKVRAMVFSSDGSRLFVGGTFTRVGGLARSRLATINPNTGAVVGGWNAGNVTGTVWLLVPQLTACTWVGTSQRRRSSANFALTEFSEVGMRDRVVCLGK